MSAHDDVLDAADRDALASDRAYAELKPGDVRCTYRRPCGSVKCSSCNPRPSPCPECGFAACRCSDLFSEATMLAGGVLDRGDGRVQAVDDAIDAALVEELRDRLERLARDLAAAPENAKARAVEVVGGADPYPYMTGFLQSVCEKAAEKLQELLRLMESDL